MPIRRKLENGWENVPVAVYKDEPGTWRSVSRRVLSDGANSDFEVRYFEVAPGGHTSYERHEHEHVVIVISGQGRVRLGDEWHDVDEHDVVHVPSQTPHQFSAGSKNAFGILCIVDRDRDGPTLLQPDGSVRSSESV